MSGTDHNTSRRGRGAGGRRPPDPNRAVTRALAADQQRDGIDLFHEYQLEDEEGAAAVIPENTSNSPSRRPKSTEPDITAEVERAHRGLEELEERRSLLESSQRDEVSMDMVKKLIQENNEVQTERMSEMFNRVLGDQLASFRASTAASEGVTIRPSGKGQAPPPRFDSLDYVGQIPRPSQVFSKDSDVLKQLPQSRNHNLSFVAQQPSQHNLSDRVANTSHSSNETQYRPIGVTHNVNTNLPFRHLQPHPVTDQGPQPAVLRPEPQATNVPNVRVQYNHHPVPQYSHGLSHAYAPPRCTCPISGANPQVPNSHHRDSNPQNSRQNYAQPDGVPPPLSGSEAPHGHRPYQYPYLPKNGLHSWDLKYDGSTGIERFIAKVDILRKANYLSWDVVVSHFHCLIKSPADRWYWSWIYSKQQANITVTWQMLHEALISHFGSAETDEDVTRILHDKRQKPNEKFADFYEDFMIIHDRLKFQKRDQELISILKRNISNRLFNLAYNIEANDLDSFRVKILKVENDLERRYTSYPSGYGTQKYTTYKKVNELYQDQETEEKEGVEENIAIDELKANHRFNKPRNPNYESKEKSVYCYKCGTLGTIFPNCPKCHNQENELEGGRIVGGSHSD